MPRCAFCCIGALVPSTCLSSITCPIALPLFEPHCLPCRCGVAWWPVAVWPCGRSAVAAARRAVLDVWSGPTFPSRPDCNRSATIAKEIFGTISRAGCKSDRKSNQRRQWRQEPAGG